MKGGAFGPGGPTEWTEQCEWLGDTKLHIVCRTEGTGPLGPFVGFGVMGYDPARQVYTHYGVDSTGWAGHAVGTRDGDTWTYVTEQTVEGETYRSRFMLTAVSPTKIEFDWQTSQDGESWTTMMTATMEKAS